MIKTLKNYLLYQQFNPSILGFFINPFYYGRKAIIKQVKHYSKFINGKTLDIGCGEKPYQSLFPHVSNYIGMDVEVSGHKNSRKKADVFYDGQYFPFENETFDSAICFEVLEHVFEPELFINEITRTLKKDGILLITVPFLWDEHEQPYDFARYSSFGLNHLFESGGFQILKHVKYLNDFRLIFLLTNNYIYKVLKKSFPTSLAWIFIILFSTIVNIIGLISFILPKNNDFYFGNVYLLKKL